MRKLAREAVIFMLLTPVAVFVGGFAYLYHDYRDAHRPDPLDAYGVAAIKGVPAGSVIKPIPCTPGEKYVDDQGDLVWSCQNGVRTAIDYDALAKKYGGVLVPSPSSQTDHPFSDVWVGSLVLGLYGVPVGLGVWMFYRVVRFAVTG